MLYIIDPMLNTIHTMLYTIDPMLNTIHTMLYTIDPMLNTIHTMLYTIDPMLKTIHTMLYTIDPMFNENTQSCTSIYTRKNIKIVTCKIVSEKIRYIYGHFSCKHKVE